jgi:DNA polymerase-1
VTNRLRGADPNLLNLPNPERDEYQIRSAVEAPPGYLFIDSDYSNLEMRIAAAIFGDQGMADDIKANRDIHGMTASMMFGEDYDAIMEAKAAKHPTEQQKRLKGLRSAAKVIGFGINYGMGSVSLSVNLSTNLNRVVTGEEAQDYIDKYFKTRPGVLEGVQYFKKMLFKTGSVRTLLGRTRTPSGTYSSDRSERAEAQRQAVNFPIQGTAADLIQLAMMQLEYDSRLIELDARMILQIHDELLFLVPEQNAEKALPRIVEIMENPIGWPGLPYDIPTKAEAGIGRTWVEAK